MITRAWTEMTEDGELWIYPVTENDQTRMEIRAVLKDATVTWSIAPSDAGLLAEMLRAISERPDPGEPPLPAPQGHSDTNPYMAGGPPPPPPLPCRTPRRLRRETSQRPLRRLLRRPNPK